MCIVCECVSVHITTCIYMDMLILIIHNTTGLSMLIYITPVHNYYNDKVCCDLSRSGAETYLDLVLVVLFDTWINLNLNRPEIVCHIVAISNFLD